MKASKQPTSKTKGKATGDTAKILQRWDNLTKPKGSLGRLEAIVTHLGKWQQTANPKAERVAVLLFAGNHGIAPKTSAFPPEVTLEMVKNFANKGAVINQLARVAGAKVKVSLLENGKPTGDFTTTSAMTKSQCLKAFRAGFESVSPRHHLICLGEMGIGNSASAAALAAALTNQPARLWVGKGTGVSGAKYRQKLAVVAAGVSRHRSATTKPMELLQRLGGFEIAAIAGAITAARHHRIPVILDGFITSVAALVVAKASPIPEANPSPKVRQSPSPEDSPEGNNPLAHCLAGHLSAEKAHKRLLTHLAIGKPILDLEMRLGEGSGAVVATLVVKAALEVYNRTHTFSEAAVQSEKQRKQKQHK